MRLARRLFEGVCDSNVLTPIRERIDPFEEEGVLLVNVSVECA